MGEVRRRTSEGVSLAEMIQDALDLRGFGEGVFMLHPLSKCLGFLGWPSCGRLFADGNS